MLLSDIPPLYIVWRHVFRQHSTPWLSATHSITASRWASALQDSSATLKLENPTMEYTRNADASSEGRTGVDLHWTFVTEPCCAVTCLGDDIPKGGV